MEVRESETGKVRVYQGEVYEIRDGRSRSGRLLPLFTDCCHFALALLFIRFCIPESTVQLCEVLRMCFAEPDKSIPGDNLYSMKNGAEGLS